MLILILIPVLSLALTALPYIVAPDLSPWWALPIAAGIYLGLSAAYLLSLLAVSWMLPKGEGQPDRPVCRFVLVQTVQWALVLLGFRIHLSGEELLPDRPFLLVGNHRSSFDPLATLVVLAKHKLSFVSKPENMKIPVAGRFMCCTSFLSIDRDNARHAVETIRRAAANISERGIAMGIYPEGTRCKTGEMLPFRNGAFKIAQMAHCPIAVTSVYYQKRRFLPIRDVYLHIIGVLDEEYVAANRTNDISERTRALLEADLKGK